MGLPLTNLSDFRLIGLKLKHKSTNKNLKAAIDCGMLWQQFESEIYGSESWDFNNASVEIYVSSNQASNSE